jgi:hypothetical protein
LTCGTTLGVDDAGKSRQAVRCAADHQPRLGALALIFDGLQGHHDERVA